MIKRIKLFHNYLDFLSHCDDTPNKKRLFFWKVAILSKIKILNKATIFPCIHLLSGQIFMHFGLDIILSRKIFLSARHLFSEVLLEIGYGIQAINFFKAHPWLLKYSNFWMCTYFVCIYYIKCHLKRVFSLLQVDKFT